MKYTVAITAAAFALIISTQSYASPLLAGVAASSASSALSSSVSKGGNAEQGQAQGQGQGQGQSSNNDISNGSGDTTAVGVGLGQAATALSPGGICGMGIKFLFGATEWSQYSSKCFNYMIAMEAAKRGEWELANQWVIRADQM